MKKIIDKNYGSIPHLSTSKLTQQADKKIGIGQENILTQKARDWKDLIIVTEKIDGSNVGIYKENGKIYALTRKGYEAKTSPYKQHHYFSKLVDFWANTGKFYFLPDKWRIVGEWCIMSHGIIYDISEESPFIAFDILDHNNKRIDYIKFIKWCLRLGIQTVPLLHIGQPISIKNCIKLLGDGHYGKPEKPEGFVMRCERENNVDFLAKWVRPDKIDGKYMNEEIWNEGFYGKDN